MINGSRSEKGMVSVLSNYTEIKKWRQENILEAADNHKELNDFHDQVIRKTVRLVMEKVEREQGEPPAPFAFYLMGSGGRSEQLLWSDQDHGIVFDGPDTCQHYFLALGKEISQALMIVGYEKCDGNIMASNPVWCKSLTAARIQNLEWLKEASWETLRYFSIFTDSRALIGDENLLKELKGEAFDMLDNHPHLYARLIDNMEFIKRSIGIFGQLLPEQSGGKAGLLDLKETAFFPYVNSTRVLALKKNCFASSTLERFNELAALYPFVESFKKDFSNLLEFRLAYGRKAKSYDKMHEISISCMSKHEKKELKRLIKHGHELFSKTKQLIKREDKW
ncbi:DUF294 nucleotidyltransferase-like domain-containing protein [Thalassobacillus pellis]|uniref:DUF294 nucleotidyltransferase-like domain-containing protein n=1 Tax=Thalassobacillus pellis TaxID=748008 RepID=UPI001EF93526|nr:DUF294 nucleotidyltransferase-like domain-containing protein [Thalassobacillus pellis]MBM7553361.1 CBS domain-containing protein [Thalassobacillus pellis]